VLIAIVLLAAGIVEFYNLSVSLLKTGKSAALTKAKIEEKKFYQSEIPDEESLGKDFRDE
jgi:uncharacterized protein (UPF0333 family)